MTFSIQLNSQAYTVDVDGDTPLLWVIRDVLGMTGTKFGCGQALCGACTVHVDGVATRSCVTTIDSIGESQITTIEALDTLTHGKALQEAWHFITHVFTATEAEVILAVLALIDLTFTGSLIVIVIFSGYENFVAKIDAGTSRNWPEWMSKIDFSGLKLKLISSIVAISAIQLLKAFMNVKRPDVVCGGPCRLRRLGTGHGLDGPHLRRRRWRQEGQGAAGRALTAAC